MPYHIIQPPFTLRFSEMSKKELADYYRWFMAVIPERIRELADAVGETPGFEAWQPDNSPGSLNLLGEWLCAKVDTRLRTQEELDEINARLRFPVEVSGDELTNRAFSLAMDAGMYLSHVFLQNHPSLRWEQQFGSKIMVDYGQPVIVRFTFGPFNPVRMLVVQTYGWAEGSAGGDGLLELYEIWAAKVLP